MELKAATRTILGKKTKHLRAEGILPAEIFGHAVPNMHLGLSEKEFVKLYRTAGENTVVNLLTDDGKKIPVLILNVNRDPITQKILAVDLYRVRMDEKIKTKIPVDFSGEAPAIKNGFVVVKVTDEIEIEALPQHIPNRFTVDLGTLENIGQSIHVGDLTTLKDVRIISNPKTVIVTVSERAKEEVVAPPTPATEAPAGTETAAQAPAGGETKTAPQAQTKEKQAK